jgi:two-component sensor histidine kinase
VPVYLKNYAKQQVNVTSGSIVIRTFQTGRPQKGHYSTFNDTAKVFIETRPVFSLQQPGKVIGVVSFDSSLIEHQRHKGRNKNFQKALKQIQAMLTHGWLHKADELSPFGEHEGLVLISRHGDILYTSGIAANFYRKLGYVNNLVGTHLESLETHDDQLVREAMRTLACVEQEDEDGGRVWVRRAVPILVKASLKQRLKLFFTRTEQADPHLTSILLILRDVTEERRKEQEMRVKNVMIQEIHHRVKNNLQTIAALLRIQSRRIEDKDAYAAFQDATNRILSIAVIHEFLSEQGSWAINIKEVGQRILTQLRQSLITPAKNIQLSLAGPSIWLPARQATACALVTNELLQNAVEHGFNNGDVGEVKMTLIDEGDHVVIEIQDNGTGLPPGFNLQNTSSLGLQITRTLVTEDLQGSLNLANRAEGGTIAKITFSKQLFGGEEGWTENAS